LTRNNELGIGFYYFAPLVEEISPTMLIVPILYTGRFGIWQPGFEIAFALNQQHYMELTSPINTPFTMERQYSLAMLYATLNIVPFQTWRHVSPYLGVAIGFIHLWDYRINQAYENNKEMILEQTSLSVVGKIGTTIFPASIFRIYLEARYYWQPHAVNRPTYESQGIGSEMAQMPNEILLDYVALGGGFKFSF